MKIIKQRIRLAKDWMSTPIKKKIAWQLVGEKASSWANISVFKNHRGKKQGWNKRDKFRVIEEK